MSSQRPLRVMFYVQHLLGIGHLMRASRIASALRAHEFDITLVTGGLPVPGSTVADVQLFQLPPIAVSNLDFKTLVNDIGEPVDDVFRQRRRDMLLERYHQIQPDIVLLEAFPFGRRQVRFELLPLIEAIETSTPKPLLLASVRDILQKRAKPGRDQESARLVLAHFDRVLVHGDPEFMQLSSSFSRASEISDRIVYTGLVSAPPSTGISAQRFDVVVSAGGGAVGAILVRASIEAAGLLPDLPSWCVIAGPNMADDEYENVIDSAPPNVSVTRFRRDFTSLLADAQLSISQAGYNTVSDVLQAGCQCVLVPFSQGGESEQQARAERLEELGIAAVVSEQQLSGVKLAEAVEVVMSADAASPVVSINADGANNTARIIRTLLGKKAR